MRSSLVSLAAACLAVVGAQAEEPAPIEIRVTDTVISTVDPGFHGLHYDGPAHKTWNNVHNKPVTLPGMYGSPSAREALKRLGMRVARIFMRCQDAHPGPGAFDWGFLDAAVQQVLDSEMIPMVCLHQGVGTWFVGDNDTPWWLHEAGRAEWRAFAAECAARYRGRVPFYEILNEPDHVNRAKPGYMDWDLSVALFVDAARAVKEITPDAMCGGAATWASWESATWAGHALEHPDGEALLDFVSYHIYTSHDLADPNARILAKTPWFEEAPRHIRAKIAERSEKKILTTLTEYNTSAVSSKDGKPYTDRRNVNAFGGLVASLAMLHSARGGCDMTMHFGTAGGFGLLVWPPRYERQPAYYAVELVTRVAGLEPGAQVLATETSETPKAVKSSIRAELESYDLESFAIRNGDHLAAVLVNKRGDKPLPTSVRFPGGSGTQATVYQYSPIRIADAPYPLKTLAAQDGAFDVTCPSYSVTVIRFGEGGE